MRLALISDIHANVEALRATFADVGNRGADRIVCLGDVVGYNANPKECLEIVRELNVPCVKGNHDEYCSTNDRLEGFNPHAADAVHWTRRAPLYLAPLPCSWRPGLVPWPLGVRWCRYGSLPPAVVMAWGVLPPAPLVREPLMGTCDAERSRIAHS